MGRKKTVPTIDDLFRGEYKRYVVQFENIGEDNIGRGKKAVETQFKLTKMGIYVSDDSLRANMLNADKSTVFECGHLIYKDLSLVTNKTYNASVVKALELSCVRKILELDFENNYRSAQFWLVAETDPRDFMTGMDVWFTEEVISAKNGRKFRKKTIKLQEKIPEVEENEGSPDIGSE